MFQSKLKKSKYSTSIIAVIFALTIFLQCCFFHYKAFHSILISSLWKEPIDFILYYAPKFIIALFLSSIVFLLKNKWWTIIVSFLISCWSICELTYYRANGMFFDAMSITMIGNMDGFWNSVPMYIYTSDFLIFLGTISLFITYILFNNKKTYKFAGTIIMLISIFLHIGHAHCLNYKDWKGMTHKGDIFYNPFLKNSVRYFWGFTSRDYITRTSVVHSCIYKLKEFILLPLEVNNYNLSSKEINQCKDFFNKMSNNIKPNSNLIIILVESFEDWAINEVSMPYLYKFISDNNVFYHKRIISQTKGGTSADGQMIINTGLLPINEGATCYRYPYNTYPALSKLYNNTAGIIPGQIDTWNQSKMSDAYGISHNIMVPNNDDTVTFNELNKHIHKYDYILVITMASHSPFETFAKKSELKYPNEFPIDITNYLKSVNYTDKQLKSFLENIKVDTILQKSTIVITGDHAAFFPVETRNQFDEYCKQHKLQYNVKERVCPLIIYSPYIKTKKIVNDIAYQMDIFPTILHVIGAENYYWKGFGVNLLDSIAIKNRHMSQDTAFDLSDKLIRSNYFYEIENQLKTNTN